MKTNTALSLEQLRRISEEWRSARPQYSDGVVLIWDGKAYGWKAELREPHHERPGVVAVNESGHVFIAEGGNYNDGAKHWVVAVETGK